MPNAPADRLNRLGGAPFLGATLPVPNYHGANPTIGGFTTGNTWFVSSTHSLRADEIANGQDPRTPFASLEYAIGACTASNGDVIYLMPGHVETIPATDLNVDVAGLQIIGLGSGATRPTINLTATGSTVAISAASQLFYNILFTGGVDNITSFLTITAADVSFINCGYRDVTGQCAIFCTASAAAARLLFNGFTYEGDIANAGTTRAFQLTGLDRFTLVNYIIEGNFSTAVITCTTTACTNLHVYNGRSRNGNAADIFVVDTVTASTGAFGPNMYHRCTDDAANITEVITGATFIGFQDIAIVNAAAESSFLWNATASADA